MFTKDGPQQPFQPGDAVLTSYGVAVIIKILEAQNVDSGAEKNENQSTTSVYPFKARLWREPGKSIASSATSYMQSSCIITKLPGAPGMSSFELDDDGKRLNSVMIHSFSSKKGTYLVSRMEGNDSLSDNNHNDNQQMDFITSALSREILNQNGDRFDKRSSYENVRKNELTLFELNLNQIECAKSAKFYPLIDELILRGNEAATAAKSVVKETKIFEKISQKVKDTDVLAVKEKGSVDGAIAAASLSGVEATNKVREVLKKSVPDSDEVRGIYTMLKDEELTSLLEKGRQRLQQLTSGGLNQVTENLFKEMGVTISGDATPSSLAQAHHQALTAIDELLSENLDVNLDSMKVSVGSTFETMFDSFSEAAKSDGTLNALLSDIDQKTTEWQQQTGRLLNTKSSSLFFEGAQRLQTRVGNILSPKFLTLCEDSKASLTKAFTEGDVALAKLKSLELGDSVRSRLFGAIEARSESHGGLDGIIAGAVTQIGGGDILDSFKNKSSSLSSGTHESLISLLGERNKYHDVTVMQLEKTLLHLESHLDQDLTSEQLASLARGEGGTSALFEPIAKNAAAEIEKQLDVAEESIEDPRILGILSNVRRIMSGQLTVTNLFDEVTNILNNDNVVNAGATIAQRGEQILDAIETVSEKKGVNDLISAVEKAGITKDAVINRIENMDMNAILDTAEQAVSDEKKRIELLSSATDSALDFLLRVLPSMPVPPFEGVRDGLIYSIDNLSMHGFRLKKEDIMVEIAGIKAAKQSNSSATIVVNETTGNDVSARKVKTTDILVIDVRNISALLEEAMWKFEKTSFPYLKGQGKANVQLSDGTIRLEFGLRKKKVNEEKWEPVLCLHNRLCTIGKIDLTIDGASGLAWVVNKLAAIFRGPLKNYVVKVIMDVLQNRSGWLLQNLNGILSAHWDLILKTTGITMDDLEEANEFDIVAPWQDPAAEEIDLVWTEFVPLGINLIMNEKSGIVKVRDFPRGSQARQVANKKGIDPDSLPGAAIVAVNGREFDATQQVDLVLALRDPARPKTVKLRLAPKANSEQTKGIIDEKEEITQAPENSAPISMKSIEIKKEGAIGIEFCSSIDNCALIVNSFVPEGLAKAADSDNLVQIGDILACINNNNIIEGKGPWIQGSYEHLQKCGLSRPLVLGFIEPYLVRVVVKKTDCHLPNDGPEEIILKEKKVEGISKIYIDGFRGVDGVAESSGVFIGDNLIFINGTAVGAGTKLRPGCPDPDSAAIQSMLHDPNAFPLCLHFARQAQTGQRKENFDIESDDIKTFSVTTLGPNELGCSMSKIGRNPNRYIVQAFHAVSGRFNKVITETVKSNSLKNLSFYSINGETLPSYASCDMVKNAMKRGWKSGKLDLVFCDEQIKRQVLSMGKES